MPRELKCLDCNHFENDAACMTALAEDSAENCPGFVDKQEVIIEEAINSLIYSGRFNKDKIQNIIDNCISHYKGPQD